MSSRRRRGHERAQRQKVTLRKGLRRRARDARGRPAAAAATALAVAVTSAASVSPQAGAAPRAERCGSPRTPSSYPDAMVGLRDRVFFTADDGVHAVELWRTDGTRTGTVRITNFPEGTGYYDGYGPQYPTVVDGSVFFTADDDRRGSELWVTDGTRRGVRLVRDVRPGEASSEPRSLTAMGDRLFFVARDEGRRAHLWSSDGTRAGTIRISDLRVSTSYDGGLEVAGDRLFFFAYDAENSNDLWTTDGTDAGTERLARFDGTDEYGGALTALGERVFFTADDGVHGAELWTSDGTSAGTQLVKDIHPGSYDSYTQELTGVGDRLFFTARDGVHGRELWTSDGTEAGTRLVRDINSDARAAPPSSLTAVGDLLFLDADDGSTGSALWRSDGTEDGTILVKDIDPDDDASYYGSLDELTDVGGRLFLTADDGVHGSELWTSDGTTGGTLLVEDVNPRSDDVDYGPSDLTAIDGRLYFSADDGVRGDELWRSDGTAAGTRLVSDVNKGGGFSIARRVANDRGDGSARVAVRVRGAGDLTVRSAARRLVKPRSIHRRQRGEVTVTLEPTARALRLLRRDARGPGVGRLEVSVRFSFTPCGGEPSTQTRRVTLELR